MHTNIHQCLEREQKALKIQQRMEKMDEKKSKNDTVTSINILKFNPVQVSTVHILPLT